MYVVRKSMYLRKRYLFRMRPSYSSYQLSVLNIASVYVTCGNTCLVCAVGHDLRKYYLCKLGFYVYQRPRIYQERYRLLYDLTCTISTIAIHTCRHTVRNSLSLSIQARVKDVSQYAVGPSLKDVFIWFV